jgi:nitroreductase
VGNGQESELEHVDGQEERNPLSELSALDAIAQRRAVRNYLPDPVPRPVIQHLIDLATLAPSAVNQQPWAFAVVDDRSTLERLAKDGKELLLAEPPSPEVLGSGLPALAHLREAVAEPGYDLFHGAPTLIVIYATEVHGVPDCYLAGENLMLAALAFGLGTCPIGLSLPILQMPEVKAELEVEDGWIAALPMVIGYPAGATPATERRPARITTWR